MGRQVHCRTRHTQGLGQSLIPHSSWASHPHRGGARMIEMGNFPFVTVFLSFAELIWGGESMGNPHDPTKSELKSQTLFQDGCGPPAAPTSCGGVREYTTPFLYRCPGPAHVGLGHVYTEKTIKDSKLQPKLGWHATPFLGKLHQLWLQF